MIIYKTTNLINGKIYVGFHKCDDDSYLGSGTILKQSVRKNGRKNFKRETLEVVNEDNWKEREIYWIDKLKSTNPKIGYNIDKGGNGQSGLSEITKKKLSESRKKYTGKNHPMYGKRGKLSPIYGHKKSEETRKKLSIAHKGKKLSEITKKKLSVYHTGLKMSESSKRKISEKNKGSNNGQYGKPRSLEHRKKLSDSLKGRNLTEDHKNNIRGFKHTPEAKKKMSFQRKGYKNARARAVIIDGVFYSYIQEASDLLNINRSTITYKLKSDKHPNYYYQNEEKNYGGYTRK